MTRSPIKRKSLIDLILAPFALSGAAANVAVSRWAHKLPVCTSIFDRFKIYPIRHHYYSPLVYQSDLRVPLSRERVINGLDLNPQFQLDLLQKFDFRDELIEIPYHVTSP